MVAYQFVRLFLFQLLHVGGQKVAFIGQPLRTVLFIVHVGHQVKLVFVFVASGRLRIFVQFTDKYLRKISGFVLI